MAGKKEREGKSPKGGSAIPGPNPRPGFPQRPGADMWDFHGHIMQERYEQSLRDGRERRQDTVGNKFGAQPPEDSAN